MRKEKGMEILELNLKHFGKFQEHKIALHSGVNIIYGGNETGKTTIHAFIRAMFFGIERARGKAGRKDEYQLRQPWENSAYFAGSMRVKYEGRVYRIERNFNKNEKEVHLICESTGEELAMEDGELSGLFGGMSEAAFRNTVFIPQAGCETDAALAEELQKFMVNFQETGDGNLDIAQALDRLKGRKKELEGRKRQEQELLDEKIARKQMEQDYVNRELEKKRNRPEAEDRGVNVFLPEREKADHGVSRRDRSGQPDNEEGPEQADIFPGFYGTFLFWVNILLLLCGVLGYMCSIFASNLLMRVILFLTGSIFLFLSGLTLRYTIRAFGGVQNCVRELGRRARRTGARGTEAEKPGETKRCGEEQNRPRTQPRDEEEKMLHFAEKTLEEGKQRWRREEDQKELQEQAVRLEAIRTELEELYDQREGLFTYDREMEAVDLAMLRIRELSAKIYREAGTEFSRTASEILSGLTEGRYTQLAMDEKMEIRINTPSRLLYLYQVSYGTMNQIYFALRMAAGELLSCGQPVPIILDEAFAMYDDERLKAALRWLNGCGRQVILFSSQTREKVLLDWIRQGK